MTVVPLPLFTTILRRWLTETALAYGLCFAFPNARGKWYERKMKATRKAASSRRTKIENLLFSAETNHPAVDLRDE